MTSQNPSSKDSCSSFSEVIKSFKVLLLDTFTALLVSFITWFVCMRTRRSNENSWSDLSNYTSHLLFHPITYPYYQLHGINIQKVSWVLSPWALWWDTLAWFISVFLKIAPVSVWTPRCHSHACHVGARIPILPFIIPVCCNAVKLLGSVMPWQQLPYSLAALCAVARMWIFAKTLLRLAPARTRALENLTFHSVTKVTSLNHSQPVKAMFQYTFNYG